MSKPTPRLPGHLLGRLFAPLRNRRGAAAVEFALVATPFIFMLFALIESGLIFIASINLSNATMLLGRQIRTGNVMAAGNSGQTGGPVLSLADFKTAICNNVQIVPLATCRAQLQIDVRTASAFGSGQQFGVVITNGTFSNSALCFYSGSSGSVVEMHAYYLWPISTPLLLNALINATQYAVGSVSTTGNYHVIVSAEAFRIEQNTAGLNTGSGC